MRVITRYFRSLERCLLQLCICLCHPQNGFRFVHMSRIHLRVELRDCLSGHHVIIEVDGHTCNPSRQLRADFNHYDRSDCTRGLYGGRNHATLYCCRNKTWASACTNICISCQQRAEQKDRGSATPHPNAAPVQTSRRYVGVEPILLVHRLPYSITSTLRSSEHQRRTA